MEKLFFISQKLALSQVFWFSGLVLFVYMLIWFMASVSKKRADLADIAWGPGFLLVAWISLFFGQASLEGLVVNILVTIWALRLAFHLYLRNRNRAEDFRYQKLKQKWVKNFNLKLFVEVFLLQGFILFVIALPVIWIHTHPQGVPEQVFWLALFVWVMGFVLETIADLELVRFKNDSSNKGKLLTSGVWSYVRHPNYLGELLQWWAIWLMAAFLPWGWVLIISPLLLTFLIVLVSGVRPLEEARQNQPDFKAYQESTPALVPPSLVNGALYGMCWSFLIIYGTQISIHITILIAAVFYMAQLYLLTKFQNISLRSCVVLSLIALGLGLLQEMLFIYLGVLVYPFEGIFPPVWLLLLYPLFSQTLNSSLAFINKSLMITFLLGGFGALLSYITGEKLGGVQLFLPLAYPVIFIFWGTFLTILVVLNRKFQSKNII